MASKSHDGFVDECGVPRVLLTTNFLGTWKWQKVPNAGVRDRYDVYKVWNPHNGVVAWRGTDPTFAHLLCDRINGWWTARDFAPPPPVYGPAYPAPVDQPETT